MYIYKYNMKIVKAVAPYNHPGFLNFKKGPYNAWVKLGGQTAKPHYPVRFLHGPAFRWELSSLWRNKKEARLRFVEPISISFDTFPDYARYEIIPFVWDCWPRYFEKMCRWLEKHQVWTAIFTSSQTVERMRLRFPEMNIMHCPEAVDTSLFPKGKPLRERTTDVFEYGRSSKQTYSDEQFHALLTNSKLTIALPRSITHPEVAGNIETLTQRFWECMLSRMVMVGHAPKELIDLVGYNPVIEMDKEHVDEQIQDSLTHIEDYQDLVDKNRETALCLGDWTLRMHQVMEWLQDCGYEVTQNDS